MKQYQINKGGTMVSEETLARWQKAAQERKADPPTGKSKSRRGPSRKKRRLRNA